MEDPEIEQPEYTLTPKQKQYDELQNYNRCHFHNEKYTLTPKHNNMMTCRTRIDAIFVI